ncbi:hypothetical protein NEMBOFW57_008913 [Staphylotrichum longicolle]|uniref:Uncharacterized protein n=1 Tax=Staphylotrichum longicolle TaxID=669026 RepID=A0AAD4ES45_9PEZI|nr:hypothetical protein NEMBOFW57_008913 [Staphylotrichum longicolle]
MASHGKYRFLDLPRHIRDDTYQKVLVVAHPLYLFKDSHSLSVDLFAPEARPRRLALLFTNRQLHAEASAILYHLNHFTFVDTTPSQGNVVQSFLDRVGPVNAAHLSHLSINFPAADSRDGRAVLREADSRALGLLREQCAGLATLELLVQQGNSRGLTAPSQAQESSSSFARDALAQVDTQLRAFPLLRKIIVRFYSGSPTPEVVELMQGYGWVILNGR